MNITLLIPSGLAFPLEDIETLDDIKNMIKFITGPSSAQLRFIFAGKSLDHATSLADQKIRDGSTIYVHEVGFQIFVRNLSGKTITIDDNYSYDTIKQVMEKIEKKDGVPWWDQILVYGGKRLREEKALAEYGIERESTLFVVSRLMSIEAV